MGRKTDDMTGRRFGLLVVEGQVPRPAGKTTTGTWWRCKCACGGTAVVARSNLVNQTSCGCKRGVKVAERNRRPKKSAEEIRQEMQDLVGKKLGSLKVEELVARPADAEQYKKVKYWYRCKCVCGEEIVAARPYLRDTRYPSCGCITAREQRHVRVISQETRDLLRIHETDPKVREAAYRRHELAEEQRRALSNRVCETCKKEFDCYAGDDWAWKFQHCGKLRNFCSYGCMRKYEKKYMVRPLPGLYL